MKPRRIEVDWEAIWEALDVKRREMGWTWRQVALMLETQDFQISSMKWKSQGVHPHTLAAMMVWLEADLRDYLR